MGIGRWLERAQSEGHDSLGALELALNVLGHPVDLGKGLAAAQKVFAESMR